MGKKAIILSMSCNQERYINEENIIRRTWGKDVLEGKYDNIELLFYRGGSDSTYLENNIIHIDEKDDLNGTYHKSLKAFRYIDDNFEYDYIIRCNTSNYINIEAINKFLDFDSIDDEIMFGASLLINGVNNWIPFLRGNFLIIPKKIINILINNNIGLSCGIDDFCFGYVLQRHYRDEYLKHILEIDTIDNINESYYEQLCNSYCVRLRDVENIENIPLLMIGLHFLYKNIKTQINPPHGFTKIYTPYGQIPIDA